MSSTTIQVENRSRLRIITFNNPRKKNALNRSAYLDLTKAINDADQDETVFVLALTGFCDFFSSGNDITGALEGRTSSNRDEQIAQDNEMIFELVKSFYSYRKLLIAVVNGPAIGIAATFVGLCDVVYCSKDAYFHTPFTLLGLSAEGCSTLTFPATLGQSKAAEMLLLNKKLSAEEALQFNFVSRLFDRSELNSVIWPEIQQHSELYINSIIATKGLMRKFTINQLEEANRSEMTALNTRMKSKEAADAVNQFMKRNSKL